VPKIDDIDFAVTSQCLITFSLQVDTNSLKDSKGWGNLVEPMFKIIKIEESKNQFNVYPFWIFEKN